MERILADQHRVEDDPEAPDVGRFPGVTVRGVENFGADVGWTSVLVGHLVIVRIVENVRLFETVQQELSSSGILEDEFPQLKISYDHSALVAMIDGRHDLTEQIVGLRLAQPTLASNVRMEILELALEYHIGAAAVQQDLLNVADVWMVAHSPVGCKDLAIFVQWYDLANKFFLRFNVKCCTLLKGTRLLGLSEQQVFGDSFTR